MRFILITILLISTHISFASLTRSTDTTLTESSQHIQLKQEVRNIQHQLDLISQNIEELNKRAISYKNLNLSWWSQSLNIVQHMKAHDVSFSSAIFTINFII